MKARELFAITAALWLVMGAGPAALAGTLAPAQAQEDPAAEPAAEAATEEKDEGIPFALYVGVGYGSADADDLELDIYTTASHNSLNTFKLEGQIVSLAEIGWKLPYEKGDFRLVFNGYTEDSYSLHAVGSLGAMQGGAPGAVSNNFAWYTVDATDGLLTTVRNPPQWTPADDADMDGGADADEIRYEPANAFVTQRMIADDLENRTQTVDFKYGRTFGGRRYNGRWWAGARYFTFDGNVPLTAWISTFTDGSGYTDGSLFRLLNAGQEASAVGPLGALEARFNFFDQRLQFYLSGEAAFVIMDVNVDTGDFVTIVSDSASGTILPIDARISASRNKSTWQNRGEAGVRLHLKSGVSFEAAYNVTGYLDARLVPTELRIPENAQEASQGTSALFITRDIVQTGWRAGVSFQF